MSRVVSMHVSGGHPNRRNSEGRDDSLPEWATESPSEGGGSFDSSGAFHGSNSDDDEHVSISISSLYEHFEFFSMLSSSVFYCRIGKKDQLMKWIKYQIKETTVKSMRIEL